MFSIMENQYKAQMKLFFTKHFQNIFLKILKKAICKFKWMEFATCMFMVNKFMDDPDEF